MISSQQNFRSTSLLLESLEVSHKMGKNCFQDSHAHSEKDEIMQRKSMLTFGL